MSEANTDTDKLIGKLRKLLNMTVENGCTEDEQESAMRMAAGFAARAGIEDQLERLKAEAREGTAQPKKKIKEKTFTQEFKIHQLLCAQAAGMLYGCKTYSYANGKGGIFFVGREENVESAEMTMFWLMRQVELLYKENLPKGMTQSARAEYRRTFKAACAHTVFKRAEELVYSMKYREEFAQESTGSTALAVLGYFEQLDKEIEDYWNPPEVKAHAEAARVKEEQRRAGLTEKERQREDREQEKRIKKILGRKGRRRTLPTGNGTYAGREAGDTVKLRKEVS